MLEYSMLHPQDNATRTAIRLDGMWRFRIDFEGKGLEEGWQDGLRTRETIPVPASFQDFYTDKDVREFCGDVWYERTVFIPSYAKGRAVSVRFAAATHRARVFLNGIEVGGHEGGFLPFCVDISSAALYGQDNRLSVIVNNELSETNIPCGITIVKSNGRKMNKPYFDFFNYSGLQRSVDLLILPRTSIFDIDTKCHVSGGDALLDYSIRLSGGEGEVSVRLVDEDGATVATAQGRCGTISVPDAHLWDVLAPYLYTFVVELCEGQELIDCYSLPVGLREVRIEGTRILLNGHSVYLKGFGKHEDSDIAGRGFSMAVMKRDAELMKWIGANSFRTSHYPYDEEIYSLADREGFLIIDEVPAVGLFASLSNFLDATNGKKTDFFSKETTPILLCAHKRAIEEMVARDKNHPSVIAWSLLNEPESTDPNSEAYFKEVFALARSLDTQKRPCTFAMEVNSQPDKCHCYHLCDIICLNRYFGWYIRGGWEIDEAERMFREEMEKWKALDLDKPFIFSEYGADTLGDVHKLPSVMWSQEYQCEVLEMLHSVFDSYDFVRGEQVWNFADFQTGEGLMRVDGNRKGIFTRQRQPKEAAFLLKRRWETLPVDYKA